MNRARLYVQLGDLERAEQLYRDSLQYLDEDRGGAYYHAENLKNLARLLRGQARYAEAREEVDRALALAEMIYGAEHAEVAVMLVDSAEMAALDAKPNDAEPQDLVERALEILGDSLAHPDALARGNALLAELHWKRGRRSPAVAALETALGLVEAQRPRTGGGERSMAEIFGRHRQWFDRMVDWQLERGDVAAAMRYVERARARSLLNQMEAARIDLASGIPDPEQRADLQVREAAAKQQVAWYQTRLRELQEAELPEAERWALIDELETKREAAYAALQAVYEETKSASVVWRDVITSGGRLETLDSTQSRLVPADALLLVYQIGVEASHLFVVPPAPHSVEVVELSTTDSAAAVLDIPSGPLTAALLDRVVLGDRGGPAARTDIVTRSASSERTRTLGVVELSTPGLLAAISRPSPEADDRILAQLAALRQVLVPGPVWERLREISEVIVIPDGSLFRFPVEALVVEPGSSWSDTRFWLDDGPALRYAASSTFLANLIDAASTSAQPPSGPDVLTVSDPKFGRRPTPPPTADVVRQARYAPPPELPGTAAETSAIVEAFGEDASRVQVLQGADATESNVRDALPGKRYVHLATHGLVDAKYSELFAALAFTPQESSAGTEQDGYLQLFEVYELDLASELVVLSACDSNVGPLVAGEGVFALSRGFFAAGARRVVASLWPVADQSTALLMGSYFRGVAEAEGSGAQPEYASLLRDAKRTVRSRSDFAAPFYWAPFAFTGVR
jgi:CHAT domain-containing protein/tetratricopeptide (TPR) repeat protein